MRAHARDRGLSVVLSRTLAGRREALAIRQLVGVPIGAFDDPAVLAAVDLGPEHLALYVVPVGAARSDGT